MTVVQLTGLSFMLTALFTYQSIAQPSVLSETEITRMFDDSQEVSWVQSYKGLCNGLHQITCTMGFDGSSYKGRICLDGGEVFDLVGSIREDKVRWEEIDEDGRVTGFVVGDISQQRITADWWSLQFTRSHTLALVATNLVELKSFAPSFSMISCQLDERSGLVSVFKESPETVSGLTLTDAAIGKWYGDCRNADCTNYHLAGDAGDLSISKIDKVACEVKWTKRSGEIVKSKGRVLYEFPLERLSRIDYWVMVDAFYPKLGHEAFDTWLSSEFANWADQITKDQDLKKHARNRWMIQATAWLDLTLVTDRYVSGIMTMWDTGMLRYRRKAFAYDLSKARLVDASEYLRQHASMDEMLQEHVRGSKSDDLNNDPLVYGTFGASGLVAFSDFDARAGDVIVLFPYSELGDAIKRSFISKITE